MGRMNLGAGLELARLLILVGIVLAVATTPAHALTSETDCGLIRMDQGSGSVARLPVTDQGNAGICFAHVAAQLADAWRATQPGAPAGTGMLPHVTSPMPPSFALASKNGRVIAFDSGTVEEALAMIREKGSCNHNKVFGALGPVMAYDGGNQQNLRDELRGAFDRYMRDISQRLGPETWADTVFIRKYDEVYRKHPRWSSERVALEARYELALSEASRLCLALDAAHFPLPRAKAGLIASTTQILAAYMATSAYPNQADNAFVTKYFENVCREHSLDVSPVPEFKNKFFPQGSAGAVRKRIHQKLNAADPLPVAITYCSGVLTHAAPYRGQEVIGNLVGCKPDSSNPDGGTHASIIVGRRWNAARKTCQLLVRNSWGESCDSDYTHVAPWSCGGSGGEIRGQIWVDEEDLSENTMEVGALE